MSFDSHRDSLYAKFHFLADDYSDVSVRGYLKYHPDIVNFRLAPIEAMTRKVREFVTREKADGSWGGSLTYDKAARAVMEEDEQFMAHECDCPFCPRAAADPAYIDPVVHVGTIDGPTT
jgi:hypothetical protein